jgi:hypothetical protein
MYFLLHERKHSVSITKTNCLIMFKEAVAVYRENHRKLTNTLCRRNVELIYVNAGGTYSYRALEGHVMTCVAMVTDAYSPARLEQVK